MNKEGTRVSTINIFIDSLCQMLRRDPIIFSLFFDENSFLDKHFWKRLRKARGEVIIK
jgi:hypothetical protein